jgi:UDP-N-acetylmuramate-alanine ligase
MRIHFIAIGGSIMHSLAIALKGMGNVVSGSDDQIYGVSKDRLMAAGLLPDKPGFFKYRITEAIDTVILGMHAKEDNPELERARELGIRIVSFPESLLQ